jgi:hypothetical protein
MRTSDRKRALSLVVCAIGLAVLAAGCGANQVKVTKSAATLIGDETVQWDGSGSATAPAGYNQGELKKWLKDSGIDRKKIAVAVARDVRACNLNSSNVEVAGSYEYDGFKGEFEYTLNEIHPVPIPIDTPKNITKRCNKSAAKALAMGIARSLRDNGKL